MIPDEVICNDSYYELFRADRNVKGGGVCIISARHMFGVKISVNKIPGIDILVVDYGGFLVTKTRIIVIYLPPKKASNAKSISLLCSLLAELSAENFQVLICGDFNFPGIFWTNNGCSSSKTSENIFIEFFTQLHLSQFITVPTRGTNILDLLFSNEKDLVFDISVISPFSSSDHNAISFSINCSFPKPKIYYSRNFKLANYSAINNYLVCYPWDHILSSSTNIEQAYCSFVQILSFVIEKFIPLTKNKTESEFLPHYILKLADYREKLWQNSKFPSVLTKFNKATNDLNRLTMKYFRNKEKFYCNKTSTGIFKFVRKKLKLSGEKIPVMRHNNSYVVSNVDKANIFARHFYNIVSGPSHNIAMPQFLGPNIIGPLYFSDSEIYDILIKSKPIRNTSPDNISWIFLKNCALPLAHPIACLFRLSLSSGKLPSIWKHSDIRPLFKKGDSSIVANYRPISLTCTLCKILERILKDHLENYFSENNIIPEQQYGFTKLKSVASQMIETLDDWSNALDNKMSIDVVYFDIRKAFDNINHARLIQKLYNVGVRGKILDWIKDFLADRTFNVSIENAVSDRYTLNRGVPQGSVLGPLLFNFYIADILDSVSYVDDVTIKFFADDLKVYIMYKPKAALPLVLQQFINDFHHWCVENDLTLAVEKCNTLHLGNNNPKFNYTLENNLIPKVGNYVRDLGFFITPNLKWTVHIRKRCSVAYGKFFSLLKVFRTLEPKLLVQLYKIYVRPVLESSSSVFNNLSKRDIALLESVQKRATRAIFNRCYKRTYNTPPPYYIRLAILNIDSLEKRRMKADLVLFQKILTGGVKINAQNMPKFNTRKFNSRRSTKFILPHTNSKFRFNSFILKTARLYSKLPVNITAISNSNLFRKHLTDSLLSKINLHTYED